MAPDTRGILRAVLEDLRSKTPGVEIRIPPNPEDEGMLDGELHISNRISDWNSRDLVLLDPFAMWRQDRHQLIRDRYGHIVDTLITQGRESPMLILFWTWGQAFAAADGDLKDTNPVVRNGYQDLRSRLHDEGRHFIRIAWRWGLQFAMWVLVPDSHLKRLAAALQQHCGGTRDHLKKHGCSGRMANHEVEVLVD